jgi:nucleoside-diphosphate-sugar epimerase
MAALALKVVVVGAAGFVGRRTLEVLAGEPAFSAVGASRGPAPGWVGAIPWRICDATDAGSVAAALAGADCAVNCVAGDGRTLIEATRTLCAAARAAGLRRVVHLSSMAVYGGATGLVDETRPLAPFSTYGRAKAEAEALVRGFVRDGGDAVILRPGCIHGPRSAQWTVRIGRLLRAGRLGDLGAAGDGGCNLVHVDDVAAAVVAALQRPDIAGEAFNLGDPDPGTWNSYFIALARAIGATPVRRITARWLQIETRLLAIPLKAAQIGAARARVAALAGLVPEPMPRSLLGLWRQDIHLDHRKADAGLGFARTAPDAGIASAAAWFNSRR